MNPPKTFTANHTNNLALGGKLWACDKKENQPTRLAMLLRLLNFVLVVSISVTSLLAEAPLFAQDAESFSIFLPLVASWDRGFQLSQRELEIEQLLLTEPGQRRTQLSFNPLLAAQARQKAEDMANRKYVDHVTPDGYGPNYLVKQAGYLLPPNYSTVITANNIESLAAGYNTVAAVWKAWMQSDGHRSHILGELEFYQQQTEYGIGYYASPTSPYRHYWVILIAAPGS